MLPMRFATVLLAGTLLFAWPAIAQEDASSEDAAEGAPAPSAQDELIERALVQFQATRGDECNGAPFGEPPPPDVHMIPFRPSHADDNAPLEEATLIRLFCGAGAYNESHVYFLSTQLDGLRQLSFAEPELQIRHEDEDPEKPVDEMRIVGYTAQAILVNSDFIPEDYTILSHTKWRGLGDASATGLWLFRDGHFSLVRFDVDPTYDGEINPETVLDYYSAP